MTVVQQGGIVAILWGAHCPQTEHFAQRLNAPLCKIHYLSRRHPLLAPIKYLPQSLKTWAVLYRRRPSVVFVANTPVFAPLAVYAYSRVARVPYVMDVHGHSFSGWKWAWCRPLQRALARRALVNLVDFPEYKQLFESWGAKALILERPPLSVPTDKLKRTTDPNQYNVTIVSTFKGDEPIDLLLDAARQLPEVRFFVLGDTNLTGNLLRDSAPDNVAFPGYLRDDQYWNQLYSSQAVMTLTTTRYSLVSGGIEGMALGKPLILSRQPALTDYFTKGTVFVDHSVESLVRGIQEARTQEDHLTCEIKELAAEKQERWERTFQEFLSLLGGNSC